MHTTSKFILLLINIIISNTYALSSMIPSSIDEISTPNSHFVGSSKKVIRGMAPKDINELLEYGISKVLIFKNQTKSEVDSEIAELQAAGLSANNIIHIPFEWKNIDPKNACRQTIRALKVLKSVQNSSSQKVFFHCTVGEDRTGLLAGLFNMLLDKTSMEQAFDEEMCARGYSNGNSKKPYKVTNEIEKGLTPLFLSLGSMIESKELSLNNLDESICDEIEEAVELNLDHDWKC